MQFKLKRTGDIENIEKYVHVYDGYTHAIQYVSIMWTTKT